MNRSYNVAKPKPKKHHWDNGKLAILQMKRFKEYIANHMKSQDEESFEIFD